MNNQSILYAIAFVITFSVGGLGCLASDTAPQEQAPMTTEMGDGDVLIITPENNMEDQAQTMEEQAQTMEEQAKTMGEQTQTMEDQAQTMEEQAKTMEQK